MNFFRVWSGVIFVFVALLSLRVNGQTASNSLPASLPVGSLQKMLDAAVQRPNQPYFRLFFSTTTNSYEYYGRFMFGGWLQFKSYADFQQCMMTNCWFIYTNSVVGRTDIVSSIGLYVNITYADTNNNGSIDYNAIQAGLTINTNNIGVVGTITTNTFLNVPDTAIYVYTPVQVPGLSQFTITVDSTNPPYSYVWPTTNAQAPGPYPYQTEWTTNNIVILNEWYGVGAYRARFTVAANGQTNSYTQNGDALLPSTVTMTDAHHLAAAIPSGSDTTIETSADFVHWQTVTNFPWSLETNAVGATINPNLPFQFYRAYSQ